ncbi:MAG: nodulation protein NfeD [Phycisphaerae bacterium]
MVSIHKLVLAAATVAVLASLPVAGQMTSTQSAVGQRKVEVLKARGMIGPTLADYLVKNIDDANSNLYEAIIIELDTPGGLDDSMRQIIESILKSEVPVITFVSPEGARAASAGTFIAYASHVAAMAPATNIGAAHPVEMTGGAVGEKIVNDSVAFIRSLAERRGRNVEWAEKSVRESASVSADQALKLHIIDLGANSLTDLLTKLDGRKIMIGGQPRILHTRNSEVVYRQPNWVQNFFQVLGHPNIAYVLLILGIWGLYFEMANPGMVLPGVVGGLSLILGLLALSVLPVNLAGVLLIFLAVILFTADLFTPTHGVLTVGGIIAFILGSFLLFPASPYGKVPWSLIIAGSGSTAVFFGFVLWLVIKAHHSKGIMGVERMPGMVGIAQSALNPAGVVHIRGEQWSAQSVEGLIEEGSTVEVVTVDGLILKVRKISKR